MGEMIEFGRLETDEYDPAAVGDPPRKGERWSEAREARRRGHRRFWIVVGAMTCIGIAIPVHALFIADDTLSRNAFGSCFSNAVGAVGIVDEVIGAGWKSDPLLRLSFTSGARANYFLSELSPTTCPSPAAGR